MRSIIVLIFSLIPFTSSLATEVVVISLRGSSSGSVNIHSAVQESVRASGHTLHLGANWFKSKGPGIVSDSETKDLRSLINALAIQNGGDKSDLALLVVGKSAGGVLAWNTFRQYFHDIDDFDRIALVMVDPHGAVRNDGQSGPYCDRQNLWWPSNWSSDTDLFRVYNIYQHRKGLTGASFSDDRVYKNVQISHGNIDHKNIPDDRVTHELIKEAFEFAARADLTWLVPVTWISLY